MKDDRDNSNGIPTQCFLFIGSLLAVSEYACSDCLWALIDEVAMSIKNPGMRIGWPNFYA